MNKSVLKTFMLAFGATLLAGALIKFPQEALEASTRGLKMWWEIVFPSLLPFFIISEMLISFGVVTFIGIILEPLMRPLFKVPGVGGFIWAMGMASGYPSGAKLTARMRNEKQLTRIEAERLVSFTNSSNPLFIFGAVSVGFFHNPALGIILALAHYGGNFLVGLTMRFYGKDEVVPQRAKSRTIKSILQEIHRTRLMDTRPIGRKLGDAVLSSIETLLMIGGFIILFSVINKLLFLLNITSILAYIVSFIFMLLHISTDFSLPFISGLFEITLGSQLTSAVPNVPLLHQAVITSFILAFCGFSVQAQVASILAQTDIRFAPFFFARIWHGILASCLTILIWKPIHEKLELNDSPSNALTVTAWENVAFIPQFIDKLATVGPVMTILSLLLYLIIYFQRNAKKII
ncbi:MAG: sporulation integral membrane protein YlbJ [Bacillus sp. (in: firmicutes)]